MKKFILIVCVINFSSTCVAQDFSLQGDDIEWTEGKITTNDGTTLEGLVRFNSRSGVLSFDDGRNTKVFNSRNVSEFTYFDAVRNQQRKFYTITYEDSKGIQRPQFFEVLKELKNFAVLSCQQPLDLKKKVTWDPLAPQTQGLYSNNLVTKPVASQKDIIYFFDENGELNPYLIIDNQETPRNFSSKPKTTVDSKVVGEELLKKYTSVYYDKIKEHAKKNKLKFDKKEDLLLLLSYYEKLSLETTK